MPRPRPSPPWRPSVRFARALLRDSGRHGWTAAALVAGGALVDGVSLLLIVPIVGVVTGDRAGWVPSTLAAFGVRDPLARLAVLLGGFVSVVAVRAMTLHARDMALARLSSGFITAQRGRVLRVLARAPWHRLAGLRQAEVTNLMTSEIGRVASAAAYLIQSAVALAMLLVQGALALVLAPALAGATAVLVLLGGLAVLLAQGRTRDLGTALVRGNTAIAGHLGAVLGGLKTAAAQNAQEPFLSEFDDVQRGLQTTVLSFSRQQAGGRRAVALGSGMAAALVVLAGFALRVPPAVLITLVLIFARMSAPALLVQQATQNFIYALPAFEALEAFAGRFGVADASSVTPVAPPLGAIVAHGLRYLYPDGAAGISEATLTLPPGSFVGVTGASGAGKTTLIDLLAGLLEPQAGTLAVGGQVLDDAGRSGWRECVAYVPQDGFLFHDSVRRNLAWGNAACDEAALWTALAVAEADALVRRFPDGLDTVIGERGTLLSGGERQRLALARAVLRRPRLLVLDEAMNAIDADGERRLLARLATLVPRPTMLMISHRADSFATCDHVIRVEHGVARIAHAR